jgi:cytochrome c peroxidase
VRNPRRHEEAALRIQVKLAIGALVVVTALGFPFVVLAPGVLAPAHKSMESHLADGNALQASYLAWKAVHDKEGGDRNIQVALGWSRGQSSEDSHAEGLIRLDLAGGHAVVDVDGLDPRGGWDVWLVDNQPGPNASALPDPGDHMQRVGGLDFRGGKGGHAQLSADLDPRLFDSFKVDLVAVTRAGLRPDQGTVLFGAPDLFQRLYSKARRDQAQPAHRIAALAGLAGFGPSMALADTPFNSLDPLIARGANIFFHKKFNGNGRVCASCHPPDNNFTIDPKYLAQQPANDPMFVAESQPALAVNFEKEKLLRGLGLVLENADGFDDLTNKYVLRGVQHLRGVGRYLKPGNQSVPPNERTGWGGDGAPGGGTLREFPIGAITQHLTKSLNRVNGVDFNLPTDADLDALEAFVRSLGRQDEPNFSTLQLKDPVAQVGLKLYNSPTAACITCHINGGANIPAGTNNNFDVGVGYLPNHPADLIAPGDLKPDGGFGRDPVFDANHNFLGYGLAGQIRFNSQPAIEAVDTPPMFHNNAVSTIEEAVNFYNSEAFGKSFAAQFFKIHMEPTEVEAIAILLREMNALENIRNSRVLLRGILAETDAGAAQTIIGYALVSINNGIRVLDERSLMPVAVQQMKQAASLAAQAETVADQVARDALVNQALQLLRQAKSQISDS